MSAKADDDVQNVRKRDRDAGGAIANSNASPPVSPPKKKKKKKKARGDERDIEIMKQSYPDVDVVNSHIFTSGRECSCDDEAEEVNCTRCKRAFPWCFFRMYTSEEAEEG